MLYDLEDKDYEVAEKAYRDVLKSRTARPHDQEISYLDVKQMTEILTRFRRRVRAFINLYRYWEADFDSETNDLEKYYKTREGILIRRQLIDAWELYVSVNQDYHKMRQTYLANLRQPPHWKAAA